MISLEMDSDVCIPPTFLLKPLLCLRKREHLQAGVGNVRPGIWLKYLQFFTEYDLKCGSGGSLHQFLHGSQRKYVRGHTHTIQPLRGGQSNQLFRHNLISEHLVYLKFPTYYKPSCSDTHVACIFLHLQEWLGPYHSSTCCMDLYCVGRLGLFQQRLNSASSIIFNFCYHMKWL